MKKDFKKSKRNAIPATRADVKEIITSVIKTLVPPMIRSEIKTLVPPMIRSEIKTLVPPMIRFGINDLVPTMIDTNIEKLAIMTKKSFDDVHKHFDNMVTKTEFEPFKKETERSFYNLQTDVTELKSKMINVESRLDRIEPKLDAIAIMQIE